MICEKILGKLENIDLQGKKLEFVSVEWHEAFKKIHRKVTDAGREIGIRLDDSVLKTGLLEGECTLRRSRTGHCRPYPSLRGSQGKGFSPSPGNDPQGLL